MLANELYEIIQDFTNTNDKNRYKVTSIPEMPHKLGCSDDGFPKFFVVSDGNCCLIHNLNAEILSVEYDVPCNIIEEGKETDGQRFTIITLRSGNDRLQKMFIEVFMMMLKMLPLQPTNMMIASKVESLLSIFAKLKRKPVHKLQGLWAELLLIERSKDSSIVAKAWHSQPKSKYDFTMGQDKIEVKSTSGEQRIHKFSLDQLNPSENSRLIICSTIVRESAKDKNGLSVYELYDRICGKITDNEIRFHIYEVMSETLGSDFQNAQKKFFDYAEASDTLALYDSADVPHIDKETIPEFISDVRFCSDISHLTDIREKEFERDDSTLYNALY